MEICDDGHDEIVFEATKNGCPMCDLLCENQDLVQKIVNLQEEIDDHECDPI